MDEFAAHFWSHVTKSDGCWEYAAHLGHPGYRYFRGRSAHRVSWEMENGPIPAGMMVLHKCDNPPCVNPAHLFIGDNADNMADASQKGRLVAGSGRPPRLLTIPEAAESLGLASSTVRRQVGRGRITGTKFGRDWYVTAGEVEKYRNDVMRGNR
jgi:excisionase family DNA binding protein